MRSFRSWIFLLSLVPAHAVSQTAPPDLVSIGRIDSIWSPTLQEHRRYWIYTPPSYHETKYLPQRYPVLYLLDGDAHFHSVTGLLQILGTGINGTRVVPEMVVVAIPNTDRTRDLTPTRSEKDPLGKPQPSFRTSGGGPSFLRFLSNELIPRIDSTYRTAPYRMLVGHSFGGIAVLNALYTLPNTFNAYVAIDPSVWWGERVMLTRARELARGPGLAGRALFVGQANTASPPDTTVNHHSNAILQLNRVLESENVSGLCYGYKYYHDDHHGSVPLIATYDALRFVFTTYGLHLDEALERPGYLTEHYARASEVLGYAVLPPEPVLDMLGRRSSTVDQQGKAREFYQMWADTYPTSASARQRLAEAWETTDTAKALEHDTEALTLKPGDPTITEAIRKLRTK